MFSLKSWKRLAPLLLFFLGYSLLFFLWVKTFLYTLPFLAGFLIALAVQPVIGFLQKRLKLPHGPATLAATILALVVLCGGLALLGVLAVREITAFLTRAAQNGFAEFSQPVTDFLNRAGEFLSQFDLDFLELHSQEILEALQNSMDLVVTCMGAALRLLTSLPTIVTLVIVAVCAAFFFAASAAACFAFSVAMIWFCCLIVCAYWLARLCALASWLSKSAISERFVAITCSRELCCS